VPHFSATSSEELNTLSTKVRDFQLHLEEEYSRRAKRLLKDMYYVFVDLHYQLGNAGWEDNVRAIQTGDAHTVSTSRGPLSGSHVLKLRRTRSNDSK